MNEIESGMVWVNAPLLDNAAGPFGGRKMSGTDGSLASEGLDRVPPHQARDDRSERQCTGFLVVSIADASLRSIATGEAGHRPGSGAQLMPALVGIKQRRPVRACSCLP